LDDLLNDPTTSKVVGERYGTFVAQWCAGFSDSRNASAQHWYSLKSKRGFAGFKHAVWPAFFAGPFWFAYRKLYVAAVVVVIASLCIELFPDPKFQMIMYFSLSGACAFHASGAYLIHVRDTVAHAKRLGSDWELADYVKQKGGTSWAAVGVLAGVLLIVGAIATIAENNGAAGNFGSVFNGSKCNQNDILARMSEMNATIADRLVAFGPSPYVIQQQGRFVAGSGRVQAALMRGDTATACQFVRDLEQQLAR
jgi:hypothetical protein